MSKINIDKIIQTIQNAEAKSKEYGLDEIRMTIEFADILVELLKEQMQIVRCKDCLRRHDPSCPMLDCRTRDWWYCADGERKE